MVKMQRTKHVLCVLAIRLSISGRWQPRTMTFYFCNKQLSRGDLAIFNFVCQKLATAELLTAKLRTINALQCCRWGWREREKEREGEKEGVSLTHSVSLTHNLSTSLSFVLQCQSYGTAGLWGWITLSQGAWAGRLPPCVCVYVGESEGGGYR